MRRRAMLAERGLAPRRGAGCGDALSLWGLRRSAGREGTLGGFALAAWMARLSPRGQTHVPQAPAIISDWRTITSACLIEAMSTSRPL